MAFNVIALVYILFLLDRVVVDIGLIKTHYEIFPNAVSASAILVWIGINLAIGLYMLRAERKELYGLLEITVGIATLILTAYAMKPENYQNTTIGFVGGVYVIIRGLANFSDGRVARAAQSQFRARL